MFMFSCCCNNDAAAAVISQNPLVDGDDIAWKDAIAYVPNVSRGRIIKVYDADTITIAFYMDKILYRMSVRLNGIDTPEMKGKTTAEKDAAIIAKNKVSEMVLNKVVTLRNVKLEKYGRLLADVYIGDLHLNQYLLDNKYAVPYDGGTKEVFGLDTDPNLIKPIPIRQNKAK